MRSLPRPGNEHMYVVVQLKGGKERTCDRYRFYFIVRHLGIYPDPWTTIHRY
jgi:hypothetical protein